LVTRTSSIMFWPATHSLAWMTTNKEGRHSYSALPRLRHMRRGSKHNACSWTAIPECDRQGNPDRQGGRVGPNTLDRRFGGICKKRDKRHALSCQCHATAVAERRRPAGFRFSTPEPPKGARGGDGFSLGCCTCRFHVLDATSGVRLSVRQSNGFSLT
jgi:hypothetical protein